MFKLFCRLFSLLILSTALFGCAEALGFNDSLSDSGPSVDPMQRIIDTPKIDGVPQIGPPATDLW